MRRAKLIAAGGIVGVALVAGASVAIWRPSSTKPEIQASCPQPRDTVIPDEWREQNNTGTAFYEAVLSAEARAAILRPSRVTPAPSFTSASSARQIESLLAGKVLVEPSTRLQDIGSVDWSTTSEGQYYSTQLHGFVGIGGALSSTDKLPEEIEDTISAIIKDWAVCNIPQPGLNDRAWYEGTVVKRLSNLLAALNYMKRFGLIAGWAMTSSST